MVSGSRSRTVAAILPALIACVLLVVSGCATRKAISASDPWYRETNGNGDRLLAVYEGRIPRPGQGDFQTKAGLALYADGSGAPTNYLLVRVFVGAGDTRHEASGSWTLRMGVTGYPEAEVVQLDANVPGDWRSYWRVNEEILLPLDENRSPKAGTASWGTMLSRTYRPVP